jgi:hypothetical protein
LEQLVVKHGGYRRLKSFPVARLCFDVTVRCCDRYIPTGSRTRDQKVQAARSGVQNIAEGSEASETSKNTELKLTSVARASLEEIYLDYEDFLRHRNLPHWPAPFFQPQHPAQLSHMMACFTVPPARRSLSLLVFIAESGRYTHQYPQIPSGMLLAMHHDQLQHSTRRNLCLRKKVKFTNVKRVVPSCS